MKYNSNMAMNGTASDTIAAVIEALTFLFFSEDTFTFICTPVLFIVVVSESGDKMMSHIIGVHKRADSQKGVCEARD